jgi:hypothetical protein
MPRVNAGVHLNWKKNGSVIKFETFLKAEMLGGQTCLLKNGRMIKTVPDGGFVKG